MENGSKKKINIGLTGSTGFIGSALLRHFRDSDDNIFILDNLVHPNVKEFSIDIHDKLDWVFHQLRNPFQILLGHIVATCIQLCLLLILPCQVIHVFYIWVPMCMAGQNIYQSTSNIQS